MTVAASVDLVARGAQLHVAEEALVVGRGVLVTGAEGTGRTAFAGAVAAAAGRSGNVPLWVVATPSLASVPFGAFGWLLGDGDPPSDVAATIGRITSALRRHSGAAATVLVIDDAHLLDERSAEAVLQAVVGRSVAVLATTVDGARLPPAIRRLADDGILSPIRLAPLERADVASIAGRLLDGTVAGTTAELLWRWSGGMPGLLQAIVDAGLDAGRFRPIGGRWWWVGPPLVPGELAWRVDRYLAGAEPAVDAAFDVVALAEPIELDVICSLLGAAALAELERLGLITTHRRDGVEVVHCRTPLVGAQRLATMTPLRRRYAARRLLAAVEPRSGPVDLVRRVVWHLDADLPTDADVLLAASSMVRLTDPELAKRMADANGRWNESVHAVVDLVDIHIEAGEPDEARAQFEHARRIAHTEDDIVLVEMSEFAVRLFGDRQPAAARATVAAARARRGLPNDDPELRSLVALATLLEGRPDAAADHARVASGAPAASQTASMRIELVHCATELLAGRTANALGTAERLVAAASQNAAAMVTADGMARAVIAFAQLWRGGLPPIPHAHPGTGHYPAPPYLPPSAGLAGAAPFEWPLMAGIVAHLRGDHDDAVARLGDAVVQQQAGKGLFHAEAAAWLVVALCDAAAIGDAEVALSQFPTRHLAVLPGVENWARGVLACAQRDTQRGATLLQAAAAEARLVGAGLVESRYLIELAERCGESPIDRLEQLAADLDAPLLRCLCRLAIARLRDDIEALLEGADQLAGFGLDTGAIAVATHAARVARRHQETPTIKRAAAVARRLRRTAPPLAATHHRHLSRRQAEVADLAAGGLTDREIAARLIVSVRTVESHLASAYRALGVTSRTDLASALVT